MLPLQQAYEVRYSISEYLKATFQFKDRHTQKAFSHFLNHPDTGIFKGPYISLKLPFAKTAIDEHIPLEIKPSFKPYDHQYLAFQRLYTSRDHRPISTLITTGTSSGKTECFLFPILDYCYQQLHRPGIKVIILYPMNALATDQAKRMAEAIWSDDRLKGKITAGLFIGEGRTRQQYPKDMTEDHIIENRNSIVDSPPDILLTNFKMLDYALMRNRYHNLWHYNLEDPSLLQYLVLDELHTYDGAQGTDVANLIRRLKLKLNLSPGQLCAVGTSATIGSGSNSAQLLREYAEKVFGEEFDEAAVITEHRMSLDEFFSDDETSLDAFLPRNLGLQESRLRENESYDAYILRQRRLWQLPDRLDQFQLGAELRKLKLVRDLVRITSEKIIALDQLIRELADANPDFRKLAEWDVSNQMKPREEVINSILALISEAKVFEGKAFPLFYLQVQLWIRELSGVLRNVGPDPKFIWKDHVTSVHDAKALPTYFCRECGSSGWLGVKDDNKNHFYTDSNQVYEYFFNNHKNLYFINTPDHTPVEEYQPSNVIEGYLDTTNLHIQHEDGEGLLKIYAVRKLQNNYARHFCPECNSENTIGIIGTRVATLSSITVSQILASDLDPRSEHYRKVLAFTNSVQDAAHQAGFVEARNFRFTFRSSLQKVINTLDKPVNLVELQDAFIKYWKSQADDSGQNQEEAYYYHFFPSDYKGKIDLGKDYRQRQHFTPAFKREFDERMRWEVVSEFGFNATIGRTLEKSATSGVRFDTHQLKKIYPLIKDWLDENNLMMISEEKFLPFLNGLLHRIRIRGGIDHPYLSKFRNKELRLWDLNWMRDNSHFLNRLFDERSSRLPKLVTSEYHQRGLLDSTYASGNNWYHKYFSKSFPLASNYYTVINEFYVTLFKILLQEGFVNASLQPGPLNYAIEPAAIWVDNKVDTYSCNVCGSMLYAADNDNLIEGSCCLDYACKNGTYVKQTRGNLNYYHLVYNRSRTPRIYAAEHTGLLERNDREKKELDFKERPHFNSLNTLVATSTLEMGINIGTLDTAINNSVPPLTANFLQRVGRAGRDSGTALITNFAQSKPHDLFYFEEPLDMMEGDIQTPGCFLEAKDILFRHFLAFCLDSWSSEDPREHFIPGRMFTLQLFNADLQDSGFLANRIITYIKANEHKLVERFSSIYSRELGNTQLFHQLRSYLADEGFYMQIQKVFKKLQEEYRYIHLKRQEIDQYIKDHRLAASDQERKELESEQKALWGLKRYIDKRSILEHLTNVGLLPNYAFPETGVTLHGRVKTSPAKASDGTPSDKLFEIVRSSSMAIREFAPGNYFYSQGFKFSISGLDTFDWNDPGTSIRMRFCSHCDHIENELLANPHGPSQNSKCPKCGDQSWSSLNNQHVFARMQGVKSVNKSDDATLTDSKDQRDNNYYRISRHFKFDGDSSQGAWGMRTIPFGIEYFKNVTYFLINLGISSSVDANNIAINGQDGVPHHGFITCKHCGRSTSTPHLDRKDKFFNFHYGYCRYKDVQYEGVANQIFEEVFLFKETKTEALKILLPVQELDGDTQISMFRAGLELGLKKYYKGNPQHLSLVEYTEFNKQNSRFDRYLVIYDNI
ncbi:MAG: DEAD/DEAH box helicase, partial [Saprospiraceae bacterium]|nr:DEAD/DEAH box helicase [Saprospiraceae bacterium]